MSCVVEVVEIKTNKVVKTLGPMSDRKAVKVERGLLMNLNDEEYKVHTIRVSNEPAFSDLTDTQPMFRDE